MKLKDLLVVRSAIIAFLTSPDPVLQVLRREAEEKLERTTKAVEAQLVPKYLPSRHPYRQQNH